MLQQTQVATVIPYFNRFMRKFPRLEALAGAREPDVLRIWAGLGYYSRARNLLKAARTIQAEYGGNVPSSAAALRSLPGIGRYTAAAVSSIAFGMPAAVLDGNVIRVLARLFAVRGDVRTKRVQDRLWAIAETCLDTGHPGDWNQAMMELGALVCLPPPEAPRCCVCPLSRSCKAFGLGLSSLLPHARRRRRGVRVMMEVVLIERDGKLLLYQRPGKEMLLPGHWSLPGSHLLPTGKAKVIGVVRHSITHHDIRLKILDGRAIRLASKLAPGFKWVSKRRMNDYLVSSIWRKATALAGLKLK